ncbi:N-glycosylase/DNA lyase [Haliovirga abyssi]|uniref:8-oxoguanine DNA glycosylase/AP lyase n=1 Tax=Haliovirga abyssi TaxID=2996794 RepID=A0AAU9E3T6_9FUSO|nr:N-glycosylase/DNA lyase [Haliovirga abyssi]BDU51135.1 putative N-glycosylase/DNA lyase [Haliovirga abyssi]
MRDTILKIYKDEHDIFINRIEDFKNKWKFGTDKDIFIELAFCVLTPQSKARSAWSAIEKMVGNDILFNGTAEEINEYLNVVRFRNRKSEYLVLAREQFLKKGEFKIKQFLLNLGNDYEKREWIVKNIKGIGYKEAGHFLRNVGFVENLAILDRHILKNLNLSGVIDEVPKSMTKKIYLDIEEKMVKFSKEIGVPMEYLDLILWYKEAGEVFK